MIEKRFRKITSVIIALMFVVSMAVFTGCSAEPADSETAAPTPKSMTREYTDDMGRTHTIPSTITKVYSTSPIAAIMTYTLAPEKLAGWNSELRQAEIKYILPELRELPNLGGWQGKSTGGNIEEILKAKPDVVISMGDNLDETSFLQQTKFKGSWDPGHFNRTPFDRNG
jgi:iron complex transport system substrate-binding protein